MSIDVLPNGIEGGNGEYDFSFSLFPRKYHKKAFNEMELYARLMFVFVLQHPNRVLAL